MVTQTSTHIYHTVTVDFAVEYFKRQIIEADEMIEKDKWLIENTSHGDDMHEALGFWEGKKSAYEAALHVIIGAKINALVEA